MTPLLERLSDLRPDYLSALLAEGEQAGSRIVGRLVDEWARGVNRFDRPGEALFGAWVGGNWSVFAGSTSIPMRPRSVSGGCAAFTSYRRSGGSGSAAIWS